jgi:hypothetical protein
MLRLQNMLAYLLVGVLKHVSWIIRGHISRYAHKH